MDRELLLLGLLRREDMHGYQLYDFIEQSLTSCTDIKKPTAYHLLEKMADKGWLEQFEAQAGNRPARRVYRITTQGEAIFQQALRDNLAVYHAATFTGNIGLAFMDALPQPEALALLNQRRVLLQTEYDALLQVPQHDSNWQLLIDHQRHHLRSELAWLDVVIQRLSA